MEANKFLEPVSVLMDVDKSYPAITKRLVLQGLNLAATHRFKTMFLIGATYLTYKTYGLFKTFRDMAYGSPEEE